VKPGYLIPGDPEREAEEKFMKEGISVVPAIKEDLVKIAEDLGVEFEGK
jgi:LDH2 family malate/lactate/ureidoglycolate dehydrogenase